MGNFESLNLLMCYITTVLMQQLAKGVGVHAQGKLRAHGNYKTGRARE